MENLNLAQDENLEGNSEERSISDSILSKKSEQVTGVENDNGKTFSGPSIIDSFSRDSGTGFSLADVERKNRVSGKSEEKSSSENDGKKDAVKSEPKREVYASPSQIKQGNMAAAEMYVDTLEFLMGTIGKAISGSAAENFEMSAFQKKKYLAVTKNYFATFDTPIKPAIFFGINTIGVVGACAATIAAEKKKTNEQKAREKAIARSIKNKSSEGREVIKKPLSERNENEIKSAIADSRRTERPKASPIKNINQDTVNGDSDNDNYDYDDDDFQTYEGNRRKFNIDRRGFYIYTEGSGKDAKRLKVSERFEKPHPEILEMIEAGMKNIEIQRELGIR